MTLIWSAFQSVFSFSLNICLSLQISQLLVLSLALFIKVVLIKIVGVGAYTFLPLTRCKYSYRTLNCHGLRQLNPLSIPCKISNTFCILSVHKKSNKLKKNKFNVNSQPSTLLYIVKPFISVNSLQRGCSDDMPATPRKSCIFLSCFHFHCLDSGAGTSSVREPYYSNDQIWHTARIKVLSNLYMHKQAPWK